jgi:hypothetical protein
MLEGSESRHQLKCHGTEQEQIHNVEKVHHFSTPPRQKTRARRAIMERRRLTGDMFRMDEMFGRVRKRLREVEMKNRLLDIPSDDMMGYILLSGSAVNCMSIYLWPEVANNLELQYAKVVAKVIPEESPEQLERIIDELQSSSNESEHEAWLLGEALMKLSNIWNYGLKGVTRDWHLACDLIWEAASVGHPEAMTTAAMITHCYIVKTVDPVMFCALVFNVF